MQGDMYSLSCLIQAVAEHAMYRTPGTWSHTVSLAVKGCAAALTMV